MTSENAQGTISIENVNKVATITFSHPASNSFPSSMLQKLTETFEKLSKDENISIIILQSTGKTFCAGASFDELLSINDFETGQKFFSGFANVINAMRKCSKLIIGKIQGKAVGGGVGLAAACDYAFAHENASIKLSEIAIGIGPFVIEPVVSRKMGRNATTHLTLNPTQWKNAQWAKEKNLYAEIFSTEEELNAKTIEFATNLASYNNEALYEMKKVFWRNTNHWGDLLYERASISGKLVLSDYTKNALNEFKK
jgi:methylglutaconyl-CoA hydratase